MCNSKYKVDIEEFRCKEYFQGHIVSLVQDVYDIIKEDIIEICNLDHDIINSKFRKINIYFDDFINVKYFEYVKKYLNIENVEMNKEFLHDTQRYILYHYKQELLKLLSDEEIENIKTGKKIKKEKEKEKKSIDMNVPVYICHHCVDYYTYSISDMIKHNKRKTKCKQNNNINYNDAIILNKNKYVFKFDTKDLTTDNIKYIISNYNNEMTIINNAVFDKNIIKEINVKSCEEGSVYVTDHSNTEHIVSVHHPKCPHCNRSFANVYSLIRHLENDNVCLKNRRVIELKKKYNITITK
jgi:hypothetical protein